MEGFDSMLPKWAYRIVSHDCNPYEEARRPSELDLLNELNSLGAEGWELVTAIPMIREGVTDEIKYVFKRRDE
jgi:hypothetical protein